MTIDELIQALRCLSTSQIRKALAKLPEADVAALERIVTKAAKEKRP